jgi:hypothetical protein
VLTISLSSILAISGVEQSVHIPGSSFGQLNDC